MARIKVMLTILICLIVGAGCANRLSDRADAAADEEDRLLQTNETHTDNSAVTIYTNPAAHPHSRINKKRAIDSFLRSDPGRTKQLQELYEEYNKRASNPPPEDKLRNSLLAIHELSHSVNSAIAAAKIIRGHHRRLDITMEDAILMYLTQDCNWDAENARSILKRIEY
ncbi:MAG: hypothetical protein OXP71_16190 [Candidatus Poribacteria bacterium]|nr:hypothetical protein [Candidatus Poribacteria bacterium]